MLKLLVSLILVIEAIEAHDPNIAYLCREPDCGMLEPPGINNFPETEEELEQFCEPLLAWLRCELRHIEGCEPYDVEDVIQVKRFVGTFEDICSEDTLLHAAVVDNLQCLKGLLDNEEKFCTLQEGPTERIKQFTEELSENGLVSVTDNVNDTYKLYECVGFMSFFACHSLILEEDCGTVAKNAYIEIVQNLGPGAVAGCEEAYDILPALVELHRLEKEKEANVAEYLKKRK